MPSRAMQRCAAFGCTNVGAGRYCATHATDVSVQSTYDRRRGSAHARGYNSRGRWGSLRKLIIARDPLCQLQLKHCTLVSTVADHIKPRNAGGDDSMENLQGLCASCHAIKTNTEDLKVMAAHRASQRGIGGSFSREVSPGRPPVAHRHTSAK